MKFKTSDRVECYYDDGWYPGQISGVNKDKTYFVTFDDGDTLPDAIEDEVRDPVKREKQPQKSSSADNYNEQIQRTQNDVSLSPHRGAGNQSPAKHRTVVDAFVKSTTPAPAVGSPPKAKAVTMGMIIASVEKFLLPCIDPLFSSLYTVIAHKDPKARLDAMLAQLAVADGIRHVQSLFRDTEDELKLMKELRSDPAMPLSTMSLVTTISEGRARAIALSRLVYGEETIEMLKAVADLATIYSVQSMWPQVAEHMAVASQQLLSVAAAKRLPASMDMERDARITAAKIEKVFNVLRLHAIKNFGQITSGIVMELNSALEQLFNDQNLGHPEDSVQSYQEDNGYALESHALANSIGNFVNQFRSLHQLSDPSHGPTTWPSWGNVVDYMRNECPVARSWLDIVGSLLLPQNRATLKVAFLRVDVQGRGVVHPAGLAVSLRSLPGAVKLVAHTKICLSLERMKVEVFVFIDPKSGTFCDPTREGRQSVSYELPLCWEEFLAMYVMETESNDIDLLMVQVLNLVGLSQLFSGNVKAAEEVLEDAMSHLRRIGMDNEQVATDVYNSMSQLYVVKYRQLQLQRKKDLNEEASDWMMSEEGQVTLKQEMKKQRQVILKNGQPISKPKANDKAVNIVLAQQTKLLIKTRDDPTKEVLSLAFRYLIQNCELSERNQGENHVSTGASCLAVASVQNIIGNYEESRSWLVRALRIMEKVTPYPSRAIAFIQLQLSNVLQKQRHHKECIQVLSSASTFYYESARKTLAELSRSHGFISLQGIPPEKTSAAFEEVNHSLELLQRMVVLNSNAGNSWQAVEQAEVAADLAEDTYSWDSEEAALNRCEVNYS